ncbi:response regulator transcription factor [Paenibacillus sp. IITD108]|uniref:response regulator transcription factor n=1 Tax=Paenibacillus sp. IITD108 TaxID=3116649 RepID=UPI002F3E7FD4
MYNLLIVDDDYEIRNGLCKYFPWDSIGFRVVGNVENGKEAYDFILNNEVDVVLCDIKMPVMSGLDLALKLNASNSHVQIIFFSAYKDFEFAQIALEAGVRRYLLKSTNYNELIRAFSNIKEELDNIEELSQKSQDQQDPSGGFTEKVIATVKQYVETHYRDVTLEVLSQQVHMNPDYLSKYFKKHAGQLFSDYLTTVRMEAAARLLADIQLKIYEVSDMVGYSNSFNFTRAFKNYYGVTPGDYRNGKTHLDSQKEVKE